MGFPQDTYREVGQGIRRYRKIARRTQAQLAAEVGLSRASLANIEAGRQQVLVHHLYVIADALGLDSPASLLPVRPAPTGYAVQSTTLPLPEEGLSDNQRQEVLRLMSSKPIDENKKP